MLLFPLKDSKVLSATSALLISAMYYQRTLPRFLVLRDRGAHPSTTSLEQLFRDSHTMFKLRVQHLGNKSVQTSDAESETLRLMLEVLISAKKQLQNN